MSSRFELSLSANYIEHWGVVEAIRELFQNSLDQETENVENKMFFDYDSSEEVLRIGNKSSVLTVSSLLLGETTKRSSNVTIGQFGEGYKLALLVLSRLDKAITIYNYAVKEVWHPKLITSRRYGGKQILVVDVDKKHFWQSVPDNNLVFEIGSISRNEYNEICDSNLHLRPATEIIKTAYGDIICDDFCKGKVFVKGLFVNEVENLEYGYDFKPEHIKLDRDRKMVADFDLKWKTSMMWKESGDERLIELSKAGAMDVYFLKEVWTNHASKFAAVASTAYTSFKAEHGENAYPVTNQAELETIINRAGKNNIKPIIVTNSYCETISASTEFKLAVEALPEEVEVPTPTERLQAFLEDYRYSMSSGVQLAFVELIEESKNWSVD